MAATFNTSLQTRREHAARAWLRRAGFEVESVGTFQRHEDEFAAIVVRGPGRAYDDALEMLTHPDCRFRVTRETSTRFFVALEG